MSGRPTKRTLRGGDGEDKELQRMRHPLRLLATSSHLDAFLRHTGIKCKYI